MFGIRVEDVGSDIAQRTVELRLDEHSGEII